MHLCLLIQLDSNIFVPLVALTLMFPRYRSNSARASHDMYTLPNCRIGVRCIGIDVARQCGIHGTLFPAHGGGGGGSSSSGRSDDRQRGHEREEEEEEGGGGGS